MTVRRLQGIPGFSIDRVAAAAGDDPEVLRLENLDTDLPPPPEAIEATRTALSDDAANSYLPFTGTQTLRETVSMHIASRSGASYGAENVVITAGGTEAMFDVLLAITDPGDEVVLTDPTYAGMIYRTQLTGALPRLVPFIQQKDRWRLNLDELRAAVTNKTRALFIMNPSMPSGAVLNREEWEAIAELCRNHSLWLMYNAAMERIVFDGLPILHPASLPGMSERTITIGSVSKEYRMIGWRIGWVVAPGSIAQDIARVHIYNVVTPTGISQAGAKAALQSPESDLIACIQEWQRRRDEVCAQLRDFPVAPCSGGWSLLLDVSKLGLDSFAASRLLLERGKVAATPMRDWGNQNGDRFVRFVFSNENVQRLQTLRERVTRTFR